AALDGLSARAIASRLSLTEATVRSHLSAIYSKLGVAGRVELLARQNGGGVSTAVRPEPTTPATVEPEPIAAAGSPRTPRNPRVAVGLAALLVCGLVVAAVVSSPRRGRHESPISQRCRGFSHRARWRSSTSRTRY